MVWFSLWGVTQQASLLLGRCIICLGSMTFTFRGTSGVKEKERIQNQELEALRLSDIGFKFILATPVATFMSRGIVFCFSIRQHQYCEEVKPATWATTSLHYKLSQACAQIYMQIISQQRLTDVLNYVSKYWEMVDPILVMPICRKLR